MRQPGLHAVVTMLRLWLLVVVVDNGSLKVDGAMQDEIDVTPSVVLSLSVAAHHLLSPAAGDITGKCDGLLAVREQLLKKQLHIATENNPRRKEQEEERH